MSALIVFCERPPRGSWAAALLRELSVTVEVRACGPGWEARDLTEAETSDAWGLLELDASPGCLARPTLPPHLDLPRAAWLVYTSRKPALHRVIAADVDAVFHAHPVWAGALGRSTTWLPLCADAQIFRPVVGDRKWDVVFAGPDPWRADPLVELARHLSLRVGLVPVARNADRRAVARAYAEAKLVFHRHLDDSLDVRVLEALVAGRVVVSDRRANGLEALAASREHVLVYSDNDELRAAVELVISCEGRRERMERAITLGPRLRHSAAQRAKELLSALESTFGPSSSPRPPTPVRPKRESPPRSPATESPRRARRWLILAAEEPAAVWLASFAERVGDNLRRQGDEVLVVRLQRGRLQPPPSCADRVEVQLGPLPAAVTVENALLLASVGAQRVADQVARERGPFDVLIAEPPLGALLGPALAERLEVPLVLALEDCEVARRENCLTRDQLYRAELEHWAAERARLLLVPGEEAAAAARRHYSATSLAVTGWPTAADLAPPDPVSDARLLARLGLRAPFWLIRAPRLESNGVLDLAGALGQSGRQGLVIGDSFGARATGAAAVPLTRRPTAGPALEVLARSCERVLHVGRPDLGLADLANTLPVTISERADPDAVLAALAADSSAIQLPRFEPEVLDRVFEALPARACERGARVALVAGGS